MPAWRTCMKTRKAIASLALAVFSLWAMSAAFAQSGPATGTPQVAPAKPAPATAPKAGTREGHRHDDHGQARHGSEVGRREVGEERGRGAGSEGGRALDRGRGGGS